MDDTYDTVILGTGLKVSYYFFFALIHPVLILLSIILRKPSLLVFSAPSQTKKSWSLIAMSITAASRLL